MCYLKITISLFKTLIFLSVPHLIIIPNKEWLLGFLILKKKYQLTFFPIRWRLSAGRTGPAKAMVYNNSPIKTNMKRTTIYTTGRWILNVEKISKLLENINIKSIYYITLPRNATQILAPLTNALKGPDKFLLWTEDLNSAFVLAKNLLAAVPFLITLNLVLLSLSP